MVSNDHELRDEWLEIGDPALHVGALNSNLQRRARWGKFGEVLISHLTICKSLSRQALRPHSRIALDRGLETRGSSQVVIFLEYLKVRGARMRGSVDGLRES